MQPKRLEITEKQRTKLFQKAWFMWFWLILFPPLGIFLLWKQGRFTKIKRIAATVGATVYFIVPITITLTATIPLYYSQDEFLDSFNNEVKALELPYSLADVEVEGNSITSKLTKDITLIENIDDNENIHELIMIGQGEGTDIILSMGLLIGMTNPELNSEEVGQVLKDLRLFDESYEYQNNEITVENNTIRYNLKYNQSTGVIFSVSKVN